MSEIRIYTDGGCHGNPGPGGWAYRIVDTDDNVIATDAGYDPATTNNRMELTAVIRGLHEAADHNDSKSLAVVTDSEYVRQGITQWIIRWKQNGWRTTAKKPVKNVDLWKDLDAVVQQVRPGWSWVKGHAGDLHNEACDRLVQEIIASGNQA